MWWMLALLACRSSYDGPLPSGDGAAVYGRVVGLLGGGIGDVEVCARGVDVDCALSENDGDFLLDHLPEDADLIVTMAKEGHLRTAYHHHTSVDEEWRKTLMTDGLVDTMTNRVDTEQQRGMGHAMFILWSGPDYDAYERVEGVSFRVVGGGGEVFYQGGSGLPDADRTETSGSGSGGVFNLEPGTYELTFQGAPCEPWFSWDFEPGAPMPVQILPGWASYVDLVCRP
jgi:hypothetical protein